MLKLVEYDEKQRLKWNKFAFENATVFHTIEWKEFLEEHFGYKSDYYMVMDQNEEIKGLLPLMECKNLLLKKVGVSLPFVNYLDVCYDNISLSFAASKIMDILKKRGYEYIQLRFKEGELEGKAVSLDDCNYTFIILLDEDVEKVFANFTGSNRNHIRKTHKNNYFSVSFDKKNLHGFYKVYQKTMKRLGSPSPDMNFFVKVYEKFANNSELLTVIDNDTGEVIGGMSLFNSCDTVHYMWGGCLAEYNKKYVNNYMYYEAVKYAVSKGFKYLDLGRSPYNSGTYKFKEQWGTTAYKLNYYTFSKKQKAGQIDRDKFKLAVEVWKVLPSCMTDFVGKKLIKYVIP